MIEPGKVAARGPERIFQIRFPACADRLRLVRRLVQGGAILAGCSEEVASHVVIAVNEACVNVIQHAYGGDPSGEITLEVSATPAELICRVEDFAKPSDIRSIKPRRLDEVRPGGLGTHFMAELMDDCEFGHLDKRRGNYVQMRKRIG